MTDQESKEEHLFSEFTPVTRRQWEDQVKDDLKGKDYRVELFWDTLEGFTAPPFLTPEDRPTAPEKISPVFTHRGWDICQPVYHHDSKEGNEEIKKAIEGGSNACLIQMNVEGHDSMLGGDLSGLNLQQQKDADQLLQGIDGTFEIIADCGAVSPLVQAMLENTANENIRITSLYDPFSYILKYGRFPQDEEVLRKTLNHMAEETTGFSFCADGYFYHNCGAQIVQELACSLAVFSEFLANIDESRNVSMTKKMSVRLGIGPLYFPEIAKFRAARLLIARLLEAYRMDENIPVRILAQTGRTNKSDLNPNTNLIRCVTEVMSAAIGGADIIIAEPPGLPGSAELSARITRNIHHILKQEAYLNKAADPSAGSYYIEHLTDTTAEKAWNLFCEMEKEGGFLASVKSGFIQQRITESSREKEHSYRSGERKLIGSGSYPDPDAGRPQQDRFVPQTTSIRKNINVTSKEYESYEKQKQAIKKGMRLGELLPTVLNPQKVLYTPMQSFSAAALFDKDRVDGGDA